MIVGDGYGEFVTRTWLTPRQVKTLVREGWNERSVLYRPDGNRGKDATGHTEREYRGWLAPVLREVPEGASILDLGCGCGAPASRILAARFRVTGVDISDVQIDRARQLVPNAHFQRADMTTVRFPIESFQGVISLYAIIHIPIRQQRPLFRRIYRWLAPGGVFLTILGSRRWRGVEKGWLGSESPMFWDHTDADTYERWLVEAGFMVEERKFVPEGDGGHELFRLRRPK